MKLKRGDVTTISIPKDLKDQIEELKRDQTTYAEFLADVFRPVIIEALEKFRLEGDSYGDVIERLATSPTRDSDELDQLLAASTRGATFKNENTTVVTFDDG